MSGDEFKLWDHHCSCSLICRFACINPIRINIDRLRQWIYWSLEVFHAYTTLDEPDISLTIPKNKLFKIKPKFTKKNSHFDLTNFLVIAKWTIELSIQRLNRFHFCRRLPLWLAFRHFISLIQVQAFLKNKKYFEFDFIKKNNAYWSKNWEF